MQDSSIITLMRRRRFGDYFVDSAQLIWNNRGSFLGRYILLGFIPVLICLGLNLSIMIDAESSAMVIDQGEMESPREVWEAIKPLMPQMTSMWFLSIVLSIYTILYPTSYLKYAAHTGSIKLSIAEVFGALGSSLGRVLLFALVGLITFLPALVILILISAPLLLIFLIGLVPLILGTVLIGLWATTSLYAYVSEPNSDPFSAIGKGWKIVFSQFGSRVGAFISGWILCVFISTAVAGLLSALIFGIYFAVTRSFEWKVAQSLFVTLNSMLSYLSAFYMVTMVGMMYYTAQFEEKELEASAFVEDPFKGTIQ